MVVEQEPVVDRAPGRCEGPLVEPADCAVPAVALSCSGTAAYGCGSPFFGRGGRASGPKRVW
jgi:hypothetical protein